MSWGNGSWDRSEGKTDYVAIRIGRVRVLRHALGRDVTSEWSKRPKAAPGR